MKVLVLGGNGMLGRAVRAASRVEGEHQTWSTGHEHSVMDVDRLKVIAESVAPDVVVNCAGIIPERLAYNGEFTMFHTNATGQWNVARAFWRARVIYVSTDCVFSGKRRPAMNLVRNIPDPVDLYAISKRAGESSVAMGNVVVVRTSFVGLQHGLLNWMLAQADGATIPGWENALWNGGTVLDVADVIVRQIMYVQPGIYHVASDVTSKFSLLVDMATAFGKDLHIVPEPEPRINRCLEPTHYFQRDISRLIPQPEPALATIEDLNAS